MWMEIDLNITLLAALACHARAPQTRFPLAWVREELMEAFLAKSNVLIACVLSRHRSNVSMISISLLPSGEGANFPG